MFYGDYMYSDRKVIYFVTELVFSKTRLHLESKIFVEGYFHVLNKTSFEQMEVNGFLNYGLLPDSLPEAELEY